MEFKKLRKVNSQKFPDPSILLHPNVPKPLHGLNPRTILGDEWWNETRQEAYARHGFCCHACGIPKSELKYRPGILEAHEFYKMDYPKGKVYYLYAVALCKYCHEFIHNGRMSMQLRAGKISWNYYLSVLYDGFMVLKKADLPPNLFAVMSYLSNEKFAIEKGWKLPNWGESARASLQKHRNLLDEILSPDDAEWEDWRLVINGKEYEPVHKSFEDWLEYYSGIDS